MTRYVVVGCGAVGGTVGGLLALAGHDVAFAVRAPLAHHLHAHGLDLRLPTARHRVRADVVDLGRSALAEGDVVLLAVQSQDTASALVSLTGAAQRGDVDPDVVCLQNGIDNEDEVDRSFPRVHGACVSMASARPGPGVVLAHATPRSGAIVVGRPSGGVDRVDAEVAAALERSGIAAATDDDVMRWKRAKLLRNLGNAVGIVCRSDRAAMLDAVRGEGEGVFTAAGMAWTPDEVFESFPTPSLSAVDVDGTPFAGNSTWQSFARGDARLETDRLNGAVVTLGERFDVPTPVNAWVVDAIRARVRQAATMD